MNCLLCHNKTRTDKLTPDQHYIYETTCTACELEEIENFELKDKIKLHKKNNIRLYKYIGEWSRSLYERGCQCHDNLKSKSHMLKTYLGPSS